MVCFIYISKYIHFDVVILLVLNKPTTLKSAFFFLNLKVGHMFIEEDVDIMGTLKEIKIACNVKKNSLVVQPNASYINGGINHLIQFQCLANRKIMCPIKKISLLSEKKKKKNGDVKLYLSPNRSYGKIMHGHKQIEIL